APILSTREPENSLSMGYEHLSITPETEVTESNAKNLLPIASECDVTLEDKKECDELICENSSTVDVCDNHSEILFDSNNDDLSSDDESFKDIEYVDASIPDPKIASEEENIVQHDEEQEENSISLNSSQISSVHAVAPILSTREPENSLKSDNSLSLPEFEIIYDHTEETRSDNTTTHANYSLPEYDSFRFEIEPDQEELISVVMINFSNDPSISRPPPEPPDDNFDLEPEKIFLKSKTLFFVIFSINRLISNIEFLNDKPTPVCVFTSSTSIPILEESDNSLSLPEFEIIYDHTEETRSDNTTTHANYSIPEYDSFRFEIEPNQEELISVVMINFSNDPSISRPPPEPPDDNFDLEPEVNSAVMKDIDEPNEHFNPGGEIFVSTNDEDVDYFPFMFVIRIFLLYLILPEISPLFLSAKREDTVFDPGISD
nr:hypothetical protein [Tanacetum cinerariifolium]